MTFFRYVMAKALGNMKGTLVPNLATIGIIALSILIFSAFSLITFNLSTFLKGWEDKIEVVAYLKRKLPSRDIQDLLVQVRLLTGVEKVRYVSSAEALAFMEIQLGSQKNLLQGVQEDVLPPSFEFELKKEYRNATRIKEIISQLKQFPEIEDIQYGQEWVEAFSGFVQIVRLTQWILGGLLVAAMTFIIANTLQLTITSRRDEIEVMHLVGASPSFIQVPFFIEGSIQGFLGAGLAMLALFFLFKAFLYQMPLSVKGWFAPIPVTFFPPAAIAWFLSGGIVLGCFGSFIASIKIFKYSG